VRDEVVFPHEVESGLVCVVQALTADLTVQGRDAFDRLAAALGPSLAPGEGLLCGFELGGGLRTPNEMIFGVVGSLRDR
jgi:hypothetical protein